MSGRCRTCRGYHPGPHLTARGELLLAALLERRILRLEAEKALLQRRESPVGGPDPGDPSASGSGPTGGPS